LFSFGRTGWFLALGSLVFGQSGPQIIPRLGRGPATEHSAADLRIDVPLVLIPVHVATPMGASITNLGRESFRLYEDGVEQTITHFGKEDAPVSIGLLFDASGSMGNKIRKSAEAAAAFFKTANDDDEFFLIEFNERPKLTVPFTRDSDAIYRHIAHTRPVGRTALLDALHMSMVQMKNARHPRKAIVIFSDGGDNRSRYTETEVKDAMREGGMQIYSMGIFDSGTGKRTPEEQRGPGLLADLAEETGGRHFAVENLADLPDVCTLIGNELRSQYILGYAPTNGARDGRYRRIQVDLELAPGAPLATAYHRQGYYAPAQ